MTGHTIVYEVVNSSLVVDAVYSVLVEFDTLAGNVSSNTTFGKQFNMCCKNILEEKSCFLFLTFILNDKLNFRSCGLPAHMLL